MKYIKLEEKHLPRVWGEEVVFSCEGVENCLGYKSPLLIKILKATDNLSYQVHPSKESVKELGVPGSKNEVWYVLNSKPNSEIGLGVKLTDVDILKNKFQNQDIADVVNLYNVFNEDFVYIESGTLHMLGKNIEVLEVQQNNDITYRLYDFNRGRELNLEKGMIALKAHNHSKILDSHKTKLLKTEDFVMEKRTIKGIENYDFSGYEYFYIIPLTAGGLLKCDGNSVMLEKLKCYFIKDATQVILNGCFDAMFVIENKDA